VTLPELAEHLNANRVRLGLKLSIECPVPGALTPEVKAALAEHKPLIVARVANALQRGELESWGWGTTEDDASGTPPF
jgi:hypothetical protein